LFEGVKQEKAEEKDEVEHPKVRKKRVGEEEEEEEMKE
jgi:hypothetical protein